MLKKYINEMGGIREKGGNQVERPSTNKIAAPKPVRARPLALTHLANSKWLETSPIKSENPLMESNQVVEKDRREESQVEGIKINLFQNKRQT
jgi:hypothetical protein